MHSFCLFSFTLFNPSIWLNIIQPSPPHGRNNFLSFYPSDTLISASLDRSHNYLYLRKKNDMYTLRKYNNVLCIFLIEKLVCMIIGAQIVLKKANFYWVTQMLLFFLLLFYLTQAISPLPWETQASWINPELGAIN